MKNAILLTFVLTLVLISCGQNPEVTTTTNTSSASPNAVTATNKEVMTLRPYSSMKERGSIANGVVIEQSDTQSDFRVTLDGLIVIAKMRAGGDDVPRRAITVEGDPTMKHDAVLYVQQPGDPTDLANLVKELSDDTGHTPKCPDPHYPGFCSVDISGADVQIRGDGGSNPGSVALGTLGYDATRSFECLLPPLRSIAYDVAGQPPGKDLKPALLKAALPASPASAYFEIDGGGELAACPYPRVANFDTEPTNCRQFARDTYWAGKTSGVAVVQIRSAKTSNQFNTLHIKNKGRLIIAIKNDAPSGTTATSAHFVLFEKVLSGSKLPKVVLDCKEPKICVKCPGNEVLVPGCNDTQYP